MSVKYASVRIFILYIRLDIHAFDTFFLIPLFTPKIIHFYSDCVYQFFFFFFGLLIFPYVSSKFCIYRWFFSFFNYPFRAQIASTKRLHLTRFSAVIFAPSQTRSWSLSSCRTVRLQVFFGLPRFLEPWGFHSSAILVILPGCFLNT